jgi:glycosyltransferase involved in cell wall biosynthesis
MRILLWHVHGAWTTSFVHGRHDYVVPVLPDRGPDGRGRAQTYAWPSSVRELPPEALREEPFDVVVLQRPHEERLRREWLRRDVPAVYVEHNAPQGRIADMRHPFADREDIVLVHVTHFNELFWDAGATPTRVIEHGILDPGERYSGELPRAAAVINEAPRRDRVTGTDLLARFAAAAPIDLFGMDAENVRAPVTFAGDLPHKPLHHAMARRRVYLHPIRWTSLGLSLLEAMQLGMPVVALGTTEVREAVPLDAGAVSTSVDALVAALARLVSDPDEARERGIAARAAALARYGLERFLADWDALLESRFGDTRREEAIA